MGFFDNAKSKADEMKEQMGDRGDDMKDQLGDKANDAKDQAEAKFDEIKARRSEQGQDSDANGAENQDTPYDEDEYEPEEKAV